MSATLRMKRAWLALVLVIASSLMTGGAHSQPGQSFPAETIRIIVPFGPASGPDFAFRTLQPTLQDILKRPVRVENRPGAGSILGTRAVVTAPPDGSTLLGATAGFSTIAATTANPGFDPLKDLTPVGFSARNEGYLLVVGAKSPYKTMEDLIAAGRKSVLHYGSPGIGSALHLVGALFGEKAGATFKHVPYPGVADAVLATARGEVDFVFSALVTTIGHIKSGDLRVIGYAGSVPLSAMPSVPLVSSVAPGFRMSEPWAGVLAPGKTPSSIVTILNESIRHASEEPRYRETLKKGGYSSFSSTPQEFRTFLEQNIEEWKQAARAAGMQPK